MSTIVRAASADDLPALEPFLPAFLNPPRKRERFVHALANGDVVVAVEGADVAGFMWLHEHFFGHTFVNVLAVAPRSRRRGHAGVLLAHAERSAVTDRVFTSTNASNVAMQAVCDRYGWRRCGLVDDLDPGDPEIVYVKFPPAGVS